MRNFSVFLGRVFIELNWKRIDHHALNVGNTLFLSPNSRRIQGKKHAKLLRRRQCIERALASRGRYGRLGSFEFHVFRKTYYNLLIHIQSANDIASVFVNTSKHEIEDDPIFYVLNMLKLRPRICCVFPSFMPFIHSIFLLLFNLNLLPSAFVFSP